MDDCFMYGLAYMDVVFKLQSKMSLFKVIHA